MSDPVTNVQIEDVLASIRRLVSEEVRAQTREEPAAGRQSPFRSGTRAEAEEAESPAPQPQKAEKLILAPHLRVAGSDEDENSADESAVRYSAEDFAPETASPESEQAYSDLDAELDEIEPAPFTEVSEDDEAGFAEDAEIFHHFAAAPAPTPEEPLAEDAPESSDERDFDAVLRALEFGDDAPEEGDFADYGDGAAEALEAARHSAPEDGSAEGAAEEDARFDDLDAVLSTLEFDPEPTPAPYARSVPSQVEDAEIVDDGAGFEGLFGATEEPTVIDVAEDPLILEEAPESLAQHPATDSEDDFAPELGAESEVEIQTETKAEIEAQLGNESAFFRGAFEAPLAEDAADAMLSDSEPAGDGVDAEVASQDGSSDDSLALESLRNEILAGDMGDHASGEETPVMDDPQQPAAEDPAEGLALDEQILREMVSEIVRQELQGALGERITRNVRKLVRREIQRALQSQDYI